MVIPNNLSKVSGNRVLASMKTKEEFSKEEFADMFLCVLEELNCREIYIVECVVASIMDSVWENTGMNWCRNDVIDAIEEKYGEWKQ